MFDLAFDTTRLREMCEDQSNYTTPLKHEGNFDGVKVSVVETPGWFSDQTPPDWIREQLLHGVSMCSPGPHVFLLVVPISSSFTKEDLKALVKVLKPLSERVWRYCMVLFTWGDWLSDLPVENYIVREGKELQKLLEKCGNRYHVLSPYRFGDPVPVKELFQKIIGIVKRNDQHFTTDVKQRKFQLLPWLAKEHILTEEEWKKRENELMEQVMKALTEEPEEGSVPSVRVAESMDDTKFPY
uniref:AIG1-type G domain-containing protein n=2 Tax=Cyprinodon variegatus TaxID=28743 RepID=A0A3Q2FEL2_CYPVA